MGLLRCSISSKPTRRASASDSAKEIAFTPSYVYIGWNALRPVFRDKRVRQALSHLVDRDRIIERVLFGYGEKIDSPGLSVQPGVQHRPQRLRVRPRSRQARARRGRVGRPRRGRHPRQGRRRHADAACASRSSRTRAMPRASNIGLDRRRRVAARRHRCDVSRSRLVDPARVARASSTTTPSFSAGSSRRTIPTSISSGTRARRCPAGSNHVSFKNAEADRILVEYRREFDKDKRIALYSRLQEIILDEAPYTFLYMPKSISAVDRRFAKRVLVPDRSAQRERVVGAARAAEVRQVGNGGATPRAAPC